MLSVSLIEEPGPFWRILYEKHGEFFRRDFYSKWRAYITACWNSPEDVHQHVARWRVFADTAYSATGEMAAVILYKLVSVRPGCVDYLMQPHRKKKYGGDKFGERGGCRPFKIFQHPNNRDSTRMVTSALWQVVLPCWNHAWAISSSVRCPRNSC